MSRQSASERPIVRCGAGWRRVRRAAAVRRAAPVVMFFSLREGGTHPDTWPSRNQAVARIFEEIGEILEITGEPPYKFNAYRLAARNIIDAPERLDELFRQGKLRQIHGVGQALEAKIVEYLTTGRMEYYESVRREFPPALGSLLDVPGLGPGRARAVYQQLGISSVADLEAAARTGQLAKLPGFGEKGVENLLRGLERLRHRE